MKKKLYVFALLALLVAGAAVGTLAYFTASTVTHNVITSGNIDIALVETMKEGNSEVPYPGTPVDGIVPGKEVSKIVRVENVGEHPAWVRIRVDVAVKGEDGKALSGAELQLNYHTAASDKWIYADGYYYFKEALVPGVKTTPLFDTVTFLTTMGNDYQSARISIDVQAQGVQSENNPIPDGGDVTDIKGWPKVIWQG